MNDAHPNETQAPQAYAGIGNESAPEYVLLLFEAAARYFAREGWILRTGGTPGPCLTLEAGAGEAGGAAKVFVPWEGFRGRSFKEEQVHPWTSASWTAAAANYPEWNRERDSPRKLLACAAAQVLGASTNDPASFLLTWTPCGATTPEEVLPSTGPGAAAVHIASAASVPIINVQRDEHFERILGMLGDSSLVDQLKTRRSQKMGRGRRAKQMLQDHQAAQARQREREKEEAKAQEKAKKKAQKKRKRENRKALKRMKKADPEKSNTKGESAGSSSSKNEPTVADKMKAQEKAGQGSLF